MPDLRSFAALRYGSAAGDPGGLLAPPYDVIEPGLAAALRARSPYNAVRLVLPAGDGEDRYAAAAEALRRWTADGVLVQEAEPALYVYRQEFGPPDRRAVRRALFAALRLSPLGEGEVLPHERTHAGPKRDRLALTLATRAQLSPVFLLARDPDGALLEGLCRSEGAAPLLAARSVDGEEHVLRRVVDADAVAALTQAAGARPLLVADGHHRYETALEVERRLPDRPAAGLVLACIVSDADPGLRLRPTHRALTGPPPGASWLDALEVRFALEPVSASDATGCEEAATDGGLVLWLPGDECAFRLVARSRGEAGEGRAAAASGASAMPDDAETKIGAVAFERGVLSGVLAVSAEAAAGADRLTYHRDPEAAARAAGRDGAVFYLSPPRVEDVRAVASRGGRLPPKSTYFEPKIPSGLLFRPL